MKAATIIQTWPEWLGREFDYCTWMCHEAQLPLRGVYYSNGLLTIEELPGLAVERLMTIGNSPVADISACRFDLGLAMTKVVIDCPFQAGCQGECFDPEDVSTSYMGDRVASRMRSRCGLEVSVEKYIPYETGWDNKDSPFTEYGRPTTAMNEQAFRMWSLAALAHLADVRGEDCSPFQEEAEIVQEMVSNLLWSEDTLFYHDLDLVTGSLWTRAKNLDAFYWLFYERDPHRIKSLVTKVNDESMFCGSLLPTLSFDSPGFRTDGYWDGRAWPRIHAYVGVGLARAGHARLGLEWALRAILSNTGPICPETLDPTADPVAPTYEGPCTLMGYNALVCLALLDICGFEMWTGGEFAAVARDGLPKLYIVEHKHEGACFSGVFEPGEGLSVYRDGVKICKVSPGKKVRVVADI